MLALRELYESDKELYLQAASSEPGCDNLYTDDASANIIWSLAYSGKGTRKNYVIEDEDGIFIGYCGVEEGKTPEIGISLLPAFQGRGMGLNAIRLLWEKVSMERELDYFVARVEECNIKSIKMFEKLGARRIQPEESVLLKNLRKLALEDKSLAGVLAAMEEFSNKIIWYAVAFEES